MRKDWISKRYFWRLLRKVLRYQVLCSKMHVLMNLYLQMPKIIILEISCLALLKAGIDRVKNHMYLNFDVKSLYLIYICGLRYVIRNFFFSVKNLLVDTAF